MRASAKILIALLVLLLCLAFCKYRDTQKANNEERRIAELASDAYLKVADLELVVPVVALLEPRYAYTPYSFSLGSKKRGQEVLANRAEFKKLSAESNTAPKVDRVEILIRQYQYTDERLSSLRICPLLKREWAKSFCKGEHLEMMQKLPEKFYIVDKNRTDLFPSYITVARELASDQIKKLNLKAESIDISCDANGRFCTAGTQTSSGTLAIWTVWSSEKPVKSSREVAESQGKAIHAFVKHAIGTQSDFETLRTELEAIN